MIDIDNKTSLEVNDTLLLKIATSVTDKDIELVLQQMTRFNKLTKRIEI
jgi:predicted sugar kinase